MGDKIKLFGLGLLVALLGLLAACGGQGGTTGGGGGSGGGGGGGGGSGTPTLGVSLNPSSLTLQPGGSGTSTLTVARNGFTGPVNLQASGTIVGSGSNQIQVSFNPSPIPSGQDTSSVNVTVGNAVPVGQYTITLQASGPGANPGSAILTVEVQAGGGGGGGGGGGTPGTELWTRQFGTFGGATGVAVDSSGNVLVVGYTYSTLPGQTHAGGEDAFVRKYDPNGTELWTRQFGTSSLDQAKGVAVDSSGNILVVGETAGALPGQTQAGSRDVFVRKYDAGGNELWTRQFGTSDFDEAYGVAVDSSGNVLVVGDTIGTFPGQTQAGGEDAFVRKYDPNGTELWTRQFGASGLGLDNALDVAVDSNGNVLVVGRTEGTLPGQTGAGSRDAFVRKYDAGGNELWTRQFGTSSLDEAFGVAVDSSGNILVVGATSGALPGQTHAGNWDAFVRKYDPNGTELWTRQFGTSSLDDAFGVAVDSNGNVLVVGRVYNAALPGQTQAGYGDAFVRKYDANGTELWTEQFGTLGTDEASGVAADSSGNVLVVGFINGSAFVRKYSP